MTTKTPAAANVLYAISIAAFLVSLVQQFTGQDPNTLGMCGVVFLLLASAVDHNAKQRRSAGPTSDRESVAHTPDA